MYTLPNEGSDPESDAKILTIQASFCQILTKHQP
jgi:hypothetical protein